MKSNNGGNKMDKLILGGHEFSSRLLIGTGKFGSNEILRSDSEHLLKALHKANCHAVLEIYKGAWHVFQQMPIPKASKALDDVKSFIDSIV